MAPPSKKSLYFYGAPHKKSQCIHAPAINFMEKNLNFIRKYHKGKKILLILVCFSLIESF